MERLEVSGAVRPLKWPLGVKWLKRYQNISPAAQYPTADSAKRLTSVDGLFRYTAMTEIASLSYCRAGSLKMEFVLESWSNAVIYSANWISACEGCRTDRNSRPGYSIRCMCNITARAVDMVQITPGQDGTTSGGMEIQTRLLWMKLCVM
jgi:hypothetical protein